mgnify:CR=1 FL=1
MKEKFEELDKEGNPRLVIYHFRNKDFYGNLSGRGGATCVYNPVTTAVGFAFCHPSDNFNRRLGIRIATGRMEKNPDFTLAEAKNNIKEVTAAINEYYEEMRCENGVCCC